MKPHNSDLRLIYGEESYFKPVPLRERSNELGPRTTAPGARERAPRRQTWALAAPGAYVPDHQTVD